MKAIPLLAPLVVVLGAAGAVGAEAHLVLDGKPRAQIVLAQHPPRTTRLAARELQTYVEKITGARLAIVTRPTDAMPVKVYVGRSTHMDRLGVSAKGLKDGAYRIVSGPAWLVLIGDDTDFVPIEPWPRNNRDLVGGKMQRAWSGITGKPWGYPLSQVRKHYTGSTGLFGTPNEQRVDKDGNVNVWGFDERGSFNAVCGYLRSLGVRWYMPGELGEVVPKRPTLPLPRIDRTVRPAFGVRRVNVRFGPHGRDVAMWAMRLGLRDPYGLRVAHGMATMTHTETILKTHSDWFALYGGKRDTQPGKRLNHLCYSNAELLAETVAWARAQFDHFHFDTVSVMPPDAYLSICQCTLCRGKDNPERGYRGRLSNHVWGFVNRVAKEVGKTHPTKQIVCCAYGTYTDPPTAIDKLEPNVQVILVGGRRPTSNLPQQRVAIRTLRTGWLAKTDRPIMVFENYPFTSRGFYLPAFVGRTIGRSINATKGISAGEDIWLSISRDFAGAGLNHFLVYFTARMYWGDKTQDVEAMLDEYCRLFYGPAGPGMKTFFTYCEDHWQAMEKDKAQADRALALFDAAGKTVPADSVYARRLAIIDAYLHGLRRKSVQLGQRRGPVPVLRLVGDGCDAIKIDGKLEEPAWQECPSASNGRLREIQTGLRPIYPTTFMATWRGDNLYFAIRCQEAEGEKLNIATTKNGDQAIWYGDVVEILLETETHSYYQIAVNPAGAVVDLDRGAGREHWYDWHSKAEVATHVAKDHWTVEIRIPVVQDANDPLHQVLGRKPTQSLPWHVNVCRQRIRKTGSEHSAFAPTGKPSFHVPAKFAYFYHGRSHRFPVDASVTDFLIAFRKADELWRSRKRTEAMAAFASLAKGPWTPYQKSVALRQAAMCARSVKDHARAAELAKQIPLPAVAKTVDMENLLAERKPAELVRRYGQVDIALWPFWQQGQAYSLRARALARAGEGKRAEADFARALARITDSHARMAIWLARGENHERNLRDPIAALHAYQQIASASSHTGSATYYRGLQGAGRILRAQGHTDDALAVLRKVDADKLRGYWYASMHLALAETLAAAGKKSQALAACRKVLADKTAPASMRKAAQDAIGKLTGN